MIRPLPLPAKDGEEGRGARDAGMYTFVSFFIFLQISYPTRIFSCFDNSCSQISGGEGDFSAKRESLHN